MNALKQAIEIAGGQSALARELGLKQGHVWNWLKSGKIPAERCIQIEAATGGRVRCEDLRPDIDWSVLRGTGSNPSPCQNQAAA